MSLTGLGNHATNPRTIVVHLPDASLHLGAVVGAIGLPYPTLVAPDREAGNVADKDVLGVEEVHVMPGGEVAEVTNGLGVANDAETMLGRTDRRRRELVP